MKKYVAIIIVWLLFLSTLSFYLNLGMSATGSDFVLVEHLKFDEGVDVTAYDSSGNGNDGTLMNGASWVNGEFSKAVSLDGIDDYVNVSDSASLDITGNIRIEAWIKPFDNAKSMNIVAKWAPGNYSYALNMGVESPGKIAFLWAPDGTSATKRYLVGTSVIQERQWTNVTVVYDGSYVKLYLGGDLNNSTAYTGNLFAGNADLYIGHAADGSSYYFDGAIDEVKISRTYPPFDATIKAHCNIEGVEVSVGIIADDSPSGFNTPHTFTFNPGAHTVTVPNVDTHSDPFYRWSTGETSATITVSSAGAYTAYYGLALENHDVAVTNVTSSRTQAYPGYTLVKVYAEVKNLGTLSETFNVTAYADLNILPIGDEITVGEQKVVNLLVAETRILPFIWNTTGVPYGNYTISAVADTVPGETDTVDNTFIDGNVKIAVKGDVNGDGVVDIFDLVMVATWFGSNVPPAPYNIDIIEDGVIDIFDLVALAVHFGETEP